MRIIKLKSLFKRRIKNETGTVTLNPTLEELQNFFNNPEIFETGVPLTSPTYFACMIIRCNAIAKLPLKLKIRDEKGTRDYKEHPLYSILKSRPNSYMTPHDFLLATEFQRLEYGNAFWLPEFRHGKIVQLHLLDSKQVEIIYDDAGILNGSNKLYYRYHDSRLGELIYSSDEIVHFKNFPTKGIKGIPIKKYIYDTVANEQYSGNVLKNKYKSGLQDPVIVTYTGDLNEIKTNKIKKKFEDMGGAKNAGKVIPIPPEFDVKQLTTKLVDSQFFELQGMTARHISNAFGVKSFQLNDLSKSTYSNIFEQNRAFYSDTMQNVTVSYEQEINYKLLFDYEREKDVFAKFNVDSMLQTDIKTRYEAYQTGISSGFLKISEARKKEDLPFVEGSDVLIIGNGASIPLSDLGKQYEKGGETIEES